MKIYLIRTTNHDKWEFCEGIHVVSAISKKSALKMLSAKTNEEITEVILLKTSTSKILFSMLSQSE